MKIKKFEEFINYDKRIGKMIITGLEGSGKTMLLTRIAIGKMLHGLEDCWKSYKIVDEYNSLGFNFSKKYEHLAFSNIDMNCKGTYIPYRKVYKVNPYRLGLYSNEYETDIFPPGSLYCLTEGYNFLNSYLYDMFREEFKAFLKTSRQAGFDMVVDTHSVSDIFTKFKQITNRFIHLFEGVEDIKNKDGVIVDHKLYVREWTNYKDVEKFEESGKVQNCEEYCLLLGKCLHENFDTNYCKYLHLQGRKFQDFMIEHFSEIKTVEDLDNFGVDFGIIPPEGFFVKKSSRGNKKLKEDTQEELID